MCAIRTNRWARPRAARGRQSWGETEINTRNTAPGTSPETARHHPCTPATELGRLGAFNAGGRLELLRVVTQLLRVVTGTGGHWGRWDAQLVRPSRGVEHLVECANQVRGVLVVEPILDVYLAQQADRCHF